MSIWCDHEPIIKFLLDRVVRLTVDLEKSLEAEKRLLDELRLIRSDESLSIDTPDTVSEVRIDETTLEV